MNAKREQNCDYIKKGINMGKIFSDSVEQALRYIYYDMRQGKGSEGFKLLEEASAAGDGDASCILARCLCGYQYVWDGHHFPEDEKRAVKLYHKSVERGSAVGVLVCLRCGELTPSIEQKMPFANLLEAFNEVLKKAEAGDAFCQYTIANSYFWWDFLRIQGKSQNSFTSQAEYKAYLKENISRCEDWFWKALRGGMYFAANNLNRYYTQGDEDIIAPQPEKAKDLYKTAAQLGYPNLQYVYAKDLLKAGEKQEAFEWFQRAASGGEADAWFYLGDIYETGELVAQDNVYARECYEKGMSQSQSTGNKAACANGLGGIYFEGKGVEPDYYKAFKYLSYAYDNGSTWGVFYLGKCCFKGWGTEQDYVKAKEFLEQVDWNNKEAWYMLGYIYCRGLGVQEDIKQGVEYLQKAGNLQEAKGELIHYKKTLFGKWVRR